MWKNFIRSASETVSQVGLQFLYDPTSTAKKMKTKLGLSTSGEPVVSEARTKFQIGLLSEVQNARATNILQLIERASLKRAAKFELGLLKSPIETSPERKNFSGLERPLYVLTSSIPYTQSGYTIRSHFLLKALKKAGVPVGAVTRSGYPSSIGTLTSTPVQDIDGVRYRLNSHWFARTSFDGQLKQAVDGLVREARKHRATILHTTTDFRNAVVVSRAAKQLDIPWVYEIRGELEQTWLSRVKPELSEQARQSEYFLLSKEQERAARNAAALVFVISEQIGQRILGEGLRKEKMQLLPNAVETIDINSERNSQIISTVPNLSNASFIIGTVSAIVEYEGLDTLIYSLKYLPEDVHALIVGDGADRPRLEQLVEELQLELRVHFVGKKPMSSIDEWYKALDVFVVPRNDSQLCRNVTPIKAMQAQAFGIPVVASDLPALREVTGGYAEYAVPESSEDLARKVNEVVEKSKTSRISQEGLPEWLQTRTWDANAYKIMTSFKAI
ncbi:glycosyltransferase family 4 protein [Corynebacterium casei]|uniref:glycosyltransferase family 4 protein n=1 Tax=Corynebacterium casei TaxID=160386 RepID=UPI003FCFA48B